MPSVKVCVEFSVEIDDLRKYQTKDDISNLVVLNPHKGTVFTESDLMEFMNIDKKMIKKLINRGLNPYPVKENGEHCFSKNELTRFARTTEGSDLDEEFARFLPGVYGNDRNYAVYEQPYDMTRNVYAAKVISRHWTAHSARKACRKLVKKDKELYSYENGETFRCFDYFVDTVYWPHKYTPNYVDEF